jgi:hypothetical protein
VIQVMTKTYSLSYFALPILVRLRMAQPNHVQGQHLRGQEEQTQDSGLESAGTQTAHHALTFSSAGLVLFYQTQGFLFYLKAFVLVQNGI